MTTLTTHEVLCRAKGYLLTHGWARDYGMPGDPACANGAIHHVTWGVCPGTRGQARRALALAATGQDADDTATVTWNDEDGRTFADVIDAFDRAIIATAPKDVPVAEAVPA